VDGSLRRRDRIEKKSFDFIHRGPTFEFRLGAGNSHNGVSSVDWEVIGPKVFFCLAVSRRYALSRGSVPALDRKLSESLRRESGHGDLDIVKRRVRLPIRPDASRFVGIVFRRVPTADGDVESPRECDRVIDDDDFLMLRRADWVGVIE